MNIQITDRALEQIRDIASRQNIDIAQEVLRVAVVPGGCSGLTYDLGWDSVTKDDDQIDHYDEIRVAMDRKSYLYLEGTELDYTTGLDGDGFHFVNPNASRTCACGESFGV